MRDDKLFNLLFQIKQWHKETFLDASIGDQLLKLEEELLELKQAEDSKEHVKELADVFIVLAGLMRWDSRIGAEIRIKFISDYQKWTIDYQEVVLQAIQDKFQRNKSRTWTRLPDGRYKHSNKEED